MEKLPNKLSDCIEIALKDLKKIEADPRYAVGMHPTWHTGRRSNLPGDRCCVCFAGAVMAKTLDCNIDDNISPYELGPYQYGDLHADERIHNGCRLEALDQARAGHISSALFSTYKKVPEHYNGPREVFVTPYGMSSDEFVKDMNGIVELLREYNL